MRIIAALLISVALASFPFDLTASYEYYLFVVQWKPTDCLNKSCPSGYLSTNFNIHGLWPENWSGTYPQDCVPNSPLNITTSTETELKKYWQSNNGDSKTFWTHEWTKHGTCITPSIPCNSYFDKGVALYKQLNILSTLSAGGVKPGTSEVSKDAFIKALKYTVDTTCSTINSKSYLKEVRFCFDKNYSQVNCKGTSTCKTSFYFVSS
ncbi:unnamed protein product [Blepharisma stoltei]|uniref:Uncharacterized protein n=1 Tax=Blepharisma stoltei TaxID=1481888 RepID=A0AAU9IEZ4_9CILI|nr:unnamed protein product [Blepharisma stoltei]